MSNQPPEKPTDQGPCGVCGGAFTEHFDDKGKPTTQHVYTGEGGQLVSQAQHQKQQAKPPATQVFQLPKTAGVDAQAFGRLCEVLLEKTFLTAEEGLYIAGMGPKPGSPSNFADPNMGHS
jgi:hypothetical protein